MVKRIDAEIPVDNNVRPFTILADLNSNMVCYDNTVNCGAVQTVIDPDHFHCHNGKMFHASYVYTSVVDGANVDTIFTAGANAHPHMKLAFGAGGNSLLTMLSSPTVSSAGIAYVPINMDRDSTRTASAVVGFSGIATAGTQLGIGYVWGGQGNQRIGGASRSGNEWILEEGSTYCARITNQSGKTTACNISFEFYEVTL